CASRGNFTELEIELIHAPLAVCFGSVVCRSGSSGRRYRPQPAGLPARRRQGGGCSSGGGESLPRRRCRERQGRAAGPARRCGHADERVLVHASAASPGRPEGTVISAPKGWYDAGDYNKYIVNSGITVYTMLAAWEHYPALFKDGQLNIPESGNGLPDLLDEV